VFRFWGSAAASTPQCGTLGEPPRRDPSEGVEGLQLRLAEELATTVFQETPAIMVA